MALILVTATSSGAGKTTFCNVVTRDLRAAGVKACTFKPVSGAWLFRDEVAFRCLTEGRIYGSDALTHSEAAEREHPADTLGPVQLISGPDFELSGVVHRAGTLFAGRLTEWTQDGPRHFITINEAAFERAGMMDLVALLRERNPEVTSFGRGSDLAQYRDRTERAVRSVFEMLRQQYDTILVESHDDIALPWADAPDFDDVVVISAGVVGTYPPRDFLDTARRSLAGVGRTPLPENALPAILPDVSTRAVVRGLTPLRRVRVPCCAPRDVDAELSRAARGLGLSGLGPS